MLINRKLHEKHSIKIFLAQKVEMNVSKSVICLKSSTFLNLSPLLQGSDCVHPFIALQNCIKANPDAFSKDILEEDEVEKEDEKEEIPAQDYKIYPPKWSTEPQSPKPKL